MASLIQESREIGASEFFRLPWYFRCFRIIAEFEPIGAFELITVSRDWSPDKTNEYLNLSRVPCFGLLQVLISLTKLRYLNLEASLGHRSVEADIGSLLECVTSLSNIEYLNLGSNYNLRTIPESIGNLRKLNTLDLSFCESLQGCQLAYLQLTV